MEEKKYYDDKLFDKALNKLDEATAKLESLIEIKQKLEELKK